MAYDKREIDRYINVFENKLYEALDFINKESEKIDSDYIEISSKAELVKHYAERLEYWTSQESEEDQEWNDAQAIIDRKNDK